MAFGQLERHKGGQPMSEINVTPLVDVMLVLLVIFIITAPLLTSSIRLDLPQSAAAQPAEGAAALLLSLDSTGRAYLNDQAVTRGQLAQRLQQAAQSNPSTELQLRADKALAYGQVVDFIGLAQSAGLSRIAFVAQAQ